MQLVHQNFLRRLQTLRERPGRLVDYLRQPRSIVIGGTGANKMGLQLLRIAKDQALWHARAARVSPEVQSAYDTMDRDGIVVIPNFLPTEQFQAIRDELDRGYVEQHDAWAQLNLGPNYLCENFRVTDYPEQYPSTTEFLRDNVFVAQLASAVSRRRMTYWPHIHVEKTYNPDPNAPHEDWDYTHFLHADRHYPFIKAFYYLDDVDETMAPYTYAIGSHKLNLARIRYEYEFSVRFPKIRDASTFKNRTQEQLSADRGLLEVVEKALAEQGITPTPMVGKANTLIVTNNQGFHARGIMTSKKTRYVAVSDYKFLESPAQWMYPVLRHLY